MSKARTTDRDEEQTKASLLRLPLDVIQYAIPAKVHAGNDYDSIEATRAMIALSQTCKPWYSLFQPELDKRGAKQLLAYVLNGGKGCELFLMSSKHKIIKISDKRHLYLYKDKKNKGEERIYYKIQGEDNKQYLDDSAIKDALFGEEFNQPAENPTGCTKRNVRNRVLKVTFKRGHTFQDAAEATIKIAETNPKLFFIKATGLDHAMDLEGNRRTIKDWSPYQALFGTQNKALLLAVKPFLDIYLGTLKDGFAMAAAQEQEKFPHGFDFPPCTDEFNQLVNELGVAVTNDPQLRQNWENPSPATLELLAKYKNHRKPGIVVTGHHYNMSDLIKTHEIHDKNWNNSTWNWDQLKFFAVFVIGIEERLLTAPYLDAACTGLDNHVNKGKPLKGTFVIMNYASNKEVSVVPFKSEDPACRLGEAFVIDSYYGCGAWGSGCGVAGAANLWKTMSSKHSRAFETYAHTKETIGITRRDLVT